MIDAINNQPLTRPLSLAERTAILRRAMNATPFFNLLTVPIPNTAIADVQLYEAKQNINLDFYVVEVRTNLGQVVAEGIGSPTLVRMQLYIANTQKSLYGYGLNTPLPPLFISNNVNFDDTAPQMTWYEDRQVERMPLLVKNGDEVIADIFCSAATDDDTTFQTLLAGFNIIKYPYITPDEQKRINASLDDEPIFQTFKMDVDFDGQKVLNIENDSRPRLILGFGIADPADSIDAERASDVSILDASRHINFTNKQIPVQMLAPRVFGANSYNNTAGVFIQEMTHIYYLPIEYYFMPFANLRFTINNDLGGGDGYQLIVFTRTV